MKYNRVIDFCWCYDAIADFWTVEYRIHYIAFKLAAWFSRTFRVALITVNSARNAYNKNII